MNIFDYLKLLFNKNAFYYAYEGEKLIRKRQYLKALCFYDKAIKLAEKEEIGEIDLYYSSRAEIKKNLKDYENALIDINKAIEIQSKVYLYYFLRSEIKKRLNDYDGAEKDLQTVYEILAKDNAPHAFKLSLAYKLAEEGNLKEAAKLLEETDDISYENENTYSLKTEIYHKIGDWDNLIKTLDKLIIMFPRRSAYLDHKANALLRLKKYEEAILVIDKAIKLEPNNEYFKNFKEEVYQKYLKKD